MPTNAKEKKFILFTSVIKPYATDTNESRFINPMELFENQVTRFQGPFSPRINHPTHAFYLIAANIDAHVKILDFPSEEELVAALRERSYDYVGINSIIMNFEKVKRMAPLIKAIQPNTKVILGGHITNDSTVEKEITGIDYFAKGDGVLFMRQLLGQDVTQPIKHPVLRAGIGLRLFGIQLGERRRPTGILIPGMGCPQRCSFCSTSNFFGGKYLPYLKTGQQLFEAADKTARHLKTDNFFVMDENFLLQGQRAKELKTLMEKHRKPWNFQIFSSANAIHRFDFDELLEMGIDWIWIGLESKFHLFPKVNNIDLKATVAELQKRGIKILGSTIIGMPEHHAGAVVEEIEHSLSYGTVYHQYMLYTPLPETPLWRELKEKGVILDVPREDIHGQFRFNFVHPHLSREESEKYINLAFKTNYERLGPSMYRMMKVDFQAYQYRSKMKHPLIQMRVRRLKKKFYAYIPALWAMEKYFQQINEKVSREIRQLRREIEGEFGIRGKITKAIGPLLLFTCRLEDRRISAAQRLRRTFDPDLLVTVTPDFPVNGTQNYHWLAY
jgi:radical SAM superfamily enzyme YgiQ (UPF0313 family)